MQGPLRYDSSCSEKHLGRELTNALADGRNLLPHRVPLPLAAFAVKVHTLRDLPASEQQATRIFLGRSHHLLLCLSGHQTVAAFLSTLRPQCGKLRPSRYCPTPGRTVIPAGLSLLHIL
jgi:hypothetical protein